MMRHGLLALTIIAFAATSVSAQQPPAPRKPAQLDARRGSLELDAGYRATSVTFDDSSAPVINLEPARIATQYAVPSAVSFSGGAGWRVWKQLGVGVNVTRYSGEGDVEIDAAIPHPFVFAQGREIEGTESGLKRDELSVAMQVRAVVPVSTRMSLTVAGGPAWISATQATVTGIHYTDSYPFDTASYTSADISSSKHSGVGVSLGADLAYFFSRQVGVGFGARFTGANVELRGMTDAAVKSRVGGVDVGGGLRVRF
jgi:hypothetical protein